MRRQYNFDPSLRIADHLPDPDLVPVRLSLCLCGEKKTIKTIWTTPDAVCRIVPWYEKPFEDSEPDARMTLPLPDGNPSK